MYKRQEYGYVSTLGAQFYQSTASLDKAYTLKPMQYLSLIHILTADGGYRPFNEADKPEGFAIRDVLWSVNEYGAGSGWHKDRLLLEMCIRDSCYRGASTTSSSVRYRNGLWLSGY